MGFGIGVLGEVIKNVFGFGTAIVETRAKTKELLAKQKHSIIEAETEAIVHRIMNNTTADNEIDMITARNKKYTWKDEVITYLFLVPVIIASATPFIIAYQEGNWANLNEYVQESYASLDQLPDWYKWVLAAVVIDVLGFRSFARKIVDKWMSKSSIIKK